MAASGSRVAIAWYTVDRDLGPMVRLSTSADGGRTLAAPITIDDGDPIGRADVAILGDGTILVCWFARSGETGQLLIRSVAPSGKVGEKILVSTVDPSRRSGFPTIEAVDDSAVIAWTSHQDEASGIATALVSRE